MKVFIGAFILLSLLVSCNGKQEEQSVVTEKKEGLVEIKNGSYTEWYWTGSLAAYARFYKQRSDPHAQSEIRDYANVIGEILSMYFPVSWQALTNSESTPE